MRKNIEFSVGALLFGCLVAACSGGGSSTLPSTPHGGTTPQRRQNVAFTITIPASGSRSSKYVSASTKSVSIVETDGTATPSPAVVQNTTPGSAGCTSSASGTACTISVNANVGTDTFVVKTYDQTGGAGNLLSSGTVQGAVVAGQANSFPLTLNGAVASVKLIAAETYPQVAGSTIVTAQALDAGGNTIVGTYDSPVTLSASGNASLKPSQLASSSDQSTLTLNASQTASFTVSGTAGAATGSVTINPSSGVVFYPVGSGANDVTGFHIITGNDGKLYYTTVGLLQCNSNGFCFGSSGTLGQFDPSSGSFSEIQLSQYEPVTAYQTADGAVWVSLSHTDATTQATTGSVGHLSGSFTGSNLTVVPLPTPSPAVASRPRSFAMGADGNLYLTGNSDHRIYKIPVSNPSGAVAIPMPKYTTAPGATFQSSAYAEPNGITLGSDGKLYIANHNVLSGNVVQYDTTASAFTPFALPGVVQSQQPRYIVTGSDGNVYESSNGTCAVMPCGGALNAITTAGVFTPIPLPDGFSQPDDLASGNGFVAFVDLAEAAVGTYDFTSKEVRDYPIEPSTGQVACCSVWSAPDGVTVASDGSLWYVTYGTLSSGGPLGIAHVVMTANWSVWPTQQITINGAGTQGAQLIGVMESGNSGPFSLSSSDQNVAVLQPITGESHDFHLVGVGPGTCTVTITDKNGRSESISVSVTTTSGTVQSVGRRAPYASTTGGLF
jgi:sugar lactone lactonase YvrE